MCMRRLSYCSEYMSNDMSEICNPVMTVLLVLVGLAIAGVALFFAMNFGNTLSIPGVITLLILGVIAIASLWYLLSDARTDYEKEKLRREQAERDKKMYEHQVYYYSSEYEKERNKWFFQKWLGL